MKIQSYPRYRLKSKNMIPRIKEVLRKKKQKIKMMKFNFNRRKINLLFRIRIKAKNYLNLFLVEI
jgi:hypothetical protein